MRFEQDLDSVLPADLPNRAAVVTLAARHLELIVAANEQFNLTRITGERGAAVKHVLDSVLPWRYFADAKIVLDAGTGAGLPGIPLALVLPATKFVLTDSVGKKARFVQAAVSALGLTNAEVLNGRAEDFMRTSRADIVTGRALTPLNKFCALFGPAIRSGARALLYKGPDVEAEIATAAAEAGKQKLKMRVLDRYELPDSMGTRTMVEVSSR